MVPGPNLEQDNERRLKQKKKKKEKDSRAYRREIYREETLLNAGNLLVSKYWPVS